LTFVGFESVGSGTCAWCAASSATKERVHHQHILCSSRACAAGAPCASRRVSSCGHRLKHGVLRVHLKGRWTEKKVAPRLSLNSGV